MSGRVADVQGLAVELRGGEVSLACPGLPPVVQALAEVVELAAKLPLPPSHPLKSLLRAARGLLEEGMRSEEAKRRFEPPPVATVRLSEPEARGVAIAVECAATEVRRLSAGGPAGYHGEGRLAFADAAAGAVVVGVVQDPGDGHWYVLVRSDGKFYSRLPSPQADALACALRVALGDGHRVWQEP